MSTGSSIGNVFGSMGSGIATVGGPVGAGIGAAFSVLGGIIGMGTQIRDKKREEEERQRQLEEAQRKQAGLEDRSQADAMSGSGERAQTASPTQAPAQPEQRATAPIAGMEQPGQPQQPQQAAIMGAELASVFAGLRPGGGGFFA
jgi:hypothetical protein